MKEKENKSSAVCLVSACLIGLNTRYDGMSKEDTAFVEKFGGITLVPVCPEQLGGLPTPRSAADIKGGDGADVLKRGAKVVTSDGVEVTANFIKGARQVLKIAQMFNVDKIFLKARSPSCGVNAKLGVTAALLRQNGFDIEEI